MSEINLNDAINRIAESVPRYYRDEDFLSQDVLNCEVWNGIALAADILLDAIPNDKSESIRIAKSLIKSGILVLNDFLTNQEE